MTAHHANTDHELHSHGDTHGHGSLRGYLIGFVLSVILTAIPFWLVMTNALHDPQATALIIFALAAVQVVVHVIFFLHLKAGSEGGWTLMAFVFTTVILAIVIGGSVWVMYHLNTNMMPSTVHEASQMP